MKKHEKIRNFVEGLGLDAAGGADPRFLAYFACFNAGDYYEAHDVLEDLWLGGDREHHALFKGLIQLAGGFVHLRKQFEHPRHPTHRRRLAPAARLFALALENLEPYPAHSLGIDLDQIRSLARDTIARLEASAFSENPWSPAAAPRISPPA